MSMPNTAVATRFSPFTIPKEIALELNGLWNYAFVVQRPWDYDYPAIKRRAELIRDAKQRGIVIWSSLARATDLKTKHIIICLGAVPREKEVGLDTEHWGHITIETYSRLVEKIEYQSLVLRELHVPHPPDGFPLDDPVFQEMCYLDNETVRIWKNVVTKLNSWMFRVEEAPELTKAGDLERQLLALKYIDKNHVDEDYTQVLLRTEFKKEDRRRHQRAFTPEGSDITLDTHVSYMTVDPNVHDPPPPLKARQLPFRLPEIMDYRPGPASVATSFRVGPDYATPTDNDRMQAIAQWAILTSRPGRRSLRPVEQLEEGELPDDDDGDSDTDTIRGFDRHGDSDGHPEVDGGITPRAHYAASVAPSESDARTHLAYGTDETDSIFASPTEMAIARMEQEERNAYVPEGLEEGELIDY